VADADFTVRKQTQQGGIVENGLRFRMKVSPAQGAGSRTQAGPLEAGAGARKAEKEK
jgi:hypothetical protein